MSFPRNAINNFQRTTLPSIDSWNTNMNILKDPPKAVFTRRVDKVGQTSEITEMVDESENRAAEVIKVYARGVNPFVSVNYSNLGAATNNGLSSAPVAASLPYRLTEVFRPPVRSQYDLLPLSRLPRTWTKAFSQPGFVDYSKRAMSCGTAKDYKGVKDNLLKMSVAPTAVYRIETPIAAPTDIKHKIQPILAKSCTAPSSNILIGDIKTYQNSHYNTDKVVRDIRVTNVAVNQSRGYGSDDRHTMDPNNNMIKDSLVYKNYETNKISGVGNDERIVRNVNLSRNIPMTFMTTNTSGVGETNCSNNNYKLKYSVDKTLGRDNYVMGLPTIQRSRELSLPPHVSVQHIVKANTSNPPIRG